MNIVRWNPGNIFGGVSRTDDVLDRFLGRDLLPHWEDEFITKGLMPAVDIIEEEKEVVLKAEIPGLDKEDIAVEVNEGVLTIRGEKKEEKKEEGKRYYRSERRYGSFSRSFYLPEGVDADGIKAAYKNGLLELRVPKVKKEEEKPRKIEVAVD